MSYYYKIFTTILLFYLSSCEFYHEKTLNDTPAFTDKPSDIIINADKLPLPELKSYPFDVKNGLDITEIAIIAVINNPELKLARDDAAISQAQAFSAGLLPDPQFGFGQDYPSSGDASLVTAYNAGLSYDFLELLKFPYKSKASDAESRKADLTMLWQEWQTIIQAKQLFIKTISQEKVLTILQEYYNFLLQNKDIITQAVNSANLTSDAAGTAITVYDDISTRFHDAQIQFNKNLLDLNALLGLSPQTVLVLQNNDSDNTTITLPLDKMLSDIAARRPDLLALKSGYEAEDARYRAAILAQFPAINVGVSHARDNSDMHTKGFTITINLPIFNRGRGDIAIEDATRNRLYDEYQIRINNAVEEITLLHNEYDLLIAQYEKESKNLIEWHQSFAGAKAAYSAGHIDLFTYINLYSAYINKQIEIEQINENIREHQIALEVLSMHEIVRKEDSL